jgi:hypothetical protein
MPSTKAVPLVAVSPLESTGPIASTFDVPFTAQRVQKKSPNLYKVFQKAKFVRLD